VTGAPISHIYDVDKWSRWSGGKKEGLVGRRPCPLKRTPRHYGTPWLPRHVCRVRPVTADRRFSGRAGGITYYDVTDVKNPKLSVLTGIAGVPVTATLSW